MEGGGAKSESKSLAEKLSKKNQRVQNKLRTFGGLSLVSCSG